ncbi:MAG: YqgE/AlgH family protein [Planctomycetaceae bacterium]
MDSLKGCFLVAGCRLRDPNFFKTAVLIIEHGVEGAMGLVVNRPSSISVSNALSGTIDLPEHGELVHVGGPVEPNALFILHSAGELDSAEQPVLPGLYVASSGRCVRAGDAGDRERAAGPEVSRLLGLCGLGSAAA